MRTLIKNRPGSLETLRREQKKEGGGGEEGGGERERDERGRYEGRESEPERWVTEESLGETTRHEIL